MANPEIPTASTAAEEANGMVVKCQCGQVRFRTATPRPIGLAHCHCDDCRSQSGSAFGTSVYFPPGPGFYPFPEDVASRLSVYTRRTDSGNTMQCYFCPKCGVRLLHAVFSPDGVLRPALAVKGGCIEDPDKVIEWGKARHIFVRSAVVELQPGWETYEAAPPPPSTNVSGIGKEDAAKAKTD